MEILRKNLRPLLAKYIFSAVAATLISGVYEVVDGIFVGRKLGASGLAAITLAYPSALLVMAVGGMLAAGCGCLAALHRGRGDGDRARRVAAGGVILWLLAVLVFTCGGTFGATALAGFLGASGHLLPMARGYIFWFNAGCLAVIGSLLFDSLLRNSGHPLAAMLIMVGGALLNIALDAVVVLVLEWDLAGVAAATVVSQLLTLATLAAVMVRTRAALLPRRADFVFDRALWGRILRGGLAAFSGTAAIGVMILLNNLAINRYGTETELSVFGIINYVLSLVLLIFIGMAQGIQPLIGVNYGAGRLYRVNRILRLTLRFSLAAGTVMVFFLLLLRRELIVIFGASDPEMIEIAAGAFGRYFLSVGFAGAIFVIASYFQAIGRVLPAGLLLLGKHCLFLIPGLYYLPAVWGVDGIWLATPAGDFAALLLAALWLIWELWGRRMLREPIQYRRATSDWDRWCSLDEMVLPYWLVEAWRRRSWSIRFNLYGVSPDPAPDPCC